MKLSMGLPIFFLALFLLLSSNGAAATAAPTFASAPTISGVLLVGNTITFGVAATDPQGLPLTITYNYGNGVIDTLGKHVYLTAGVYPVTVTVSNRESSASATLAVAIKNVANLWIKKQTIKVDSAGKESWQAQYIYNADRTLVNIFNPTIDDFLASLGNVPKIQIPATVGVQRFSGAKPKFTFKSAKGSIPAISVILDESKQTITINATAETFTDTVPGIFHNAVQVGASNFDLDQTFDAKGKFTAISGYRSPAFVVSSAQIKVGKPSKPGKDSVILSLLLGDPAFIFPGASGAKTVSVRVTNVVNQIVFDKDLTNSVTSKNGLFVAPAGSFHYDSNKGNMSFKLSKAILTGFFVTSEENVRVDVTIGDQIYTTHVTLFSSGCNKSVTYNTKLPKRFCNFIPGRTIDTTAPTVISTMPANSATGVAINSKISATFSEAMNTSSLNTTTFTLMQGATAISGTVTYAATGTTATFTPSGNLAINTAFTATVSTGAKDRSGNTLAANVTWNFTTGATADNTAPNVISTNPADNATGVAINHSVNATFDEAMDPATINTTNIILAGPGPGPNPITGKVTYDAANKIATFIAGSDLAPSTQFTATVTTGVKDLAGNALVANKVWIFTTGTQQALAPVALGAAAPYGTFGGGSGMTNQGILTVVNGDIGSTGASTTVTGFHDSTGDIYTETPLNQGQVNGRIYTDAPPPSHPGGTPVGGNATTFAIATQSASDANSAYINLSPASLPGGMDPGAGQLGGLTLPPGIYQSASGSFLITGTDLTLDALGDANAVWVFQMASSLTVGGPAAPRNVILINGAQAKNVFWQVGSAATINGAGGGTMVGTIIASSGVTFSTAGNVTLVTLNGRALSLHASTTLVNTIINVPAP